MKIIQNKEQLTANLKLVDVGGGGYAVLEKCFFKNMTVDAEERGFINCVFDNCKIEDLSEETFFDGSVIVNNCEVFNLRPSHSCYVQGDDSMGNGIRFFNSRINNNNSNNASSSYYIRKNSYFEKCIMEDIAIDSAHKKILSNCKIDLLEVLVVSDTVFPIINNCTINEIMVRSKGYASNAEIKPSNFKNLKTLLSQSGTGVHFNQIIFKNVVIEGFDFGKSEFNDCSFYRCDIRNCDFSKVEFGEVPIPHASFIECIIQDSVYFGDNNELVNSVRRAVKILVPKGVY